MHLAPVQVDLLHKLPKERIIRVLWKFFIRPDQLTWKHQVYVGKVDLQCFATQFLLIFKSTC